MSRPSENAFVRLRIWRAAVFLDAMHPKLQKLKWENQFPQSLWGGGKAEAAALHAEACRGARQTVQLEGRTRSGGGGFAYLAGEPELAR
jgi:hypothetical protein